MLARRPDIKEHKKLQDNKGNQDRKVILVPFLFALNMFGKFEGNQIRKTLNCGNTVDAIFSEGNVNVLLDLNVLGDSENGFDPQRCAEFSVVDWTVPEDIWSLQLQMIGRSYVKAVGFNNRGDDMAGLS